MNNFHMTIEERIKDFEVYKVESIADSYFFVSGIPNTNEDRHVQEISSMALNLVAACGMVVRPDQRPRTIEIRVGVHTGPVTVGVVGTKMPRYSVFGETVSITQAMRDSCLPGKVQISESTKWSLERSGGFTFDEKDLVTVRDKDYKAYWLYSDYSKGNY